MTILSPNPFFHPHILQSRITKIVNTSLTNGEYSTKWKTAVVRPLLKKIGLELIKQNFRPVSNLAFISKIVERAMLLQLSQHCQDFNLQPDYQSAYRPDYSCETAILKVSNDILWAFEKKSITALVAIDLSAAFDTVDQDILLQRLNAKYGIAGAGPELVRQLPQRKKFQSCDW